MKKCAAWLVLVALVVPAAMGCSSPLQVAPDGAEVLARQVPAAWGQVLYMDTRPSGRQARHWAALRSRLEAEPAGAEALAGLLQPFALQDYGLQDVAVGPAMQVTGPGGECLVVQVFNDQEALAAAREALAATKEETVDGRPVFYGYVARGRLAWTVSDYLFRACTGYNGDPRPDLQRLLTLPESQSLAAQPAWRALRARLPDELLGLLFADLEALSQAAPGPGTTPADVFGRQFKALAVAVLPDEQGLRLQVAGQVALEESAGPQTRALFNVPDLDPAAWEHVPAGTALAVQGRDASLLWPLFQAVFNLNVLTRYTEALGLDVQADLAAPGGPLAADLAVAVLPPLADQPISQGVLAWQMLIVAPGVEQAQVARLQGAIERRGVAFGPGEAGGLALQVQAGTQASGYALTLGLDGDVLLVGTSAEVVGRAAAAARDRQGLARDAAFRTVSAVWPDRLSLAVYVDAAQLEALIQANTTTEQYAGAGYAVLSVFRAAGVGLSLDEEWLAGEALLLLR